MLKSDKPSITLSFVRDILRPTDYGVFLNWVDSQPKLMARTFAAPFPSSIHDLRPFLVSGSVNLACELSWCYLRLEPHLQRIARFNQHREQLDNEFVQGNAERALALLTDVEEEYGASIWLLKKKVAFYQEFRGLEQQKKFAQSIKDLGESVSGIVTFLVHWVSYRSEPSVSPLTFGEVFEAYLGDLNVDSDINAYLRHHISTVPPYTMDDCSGMLGIEAVGTAIDTYEMFVATLQTTITKEWPLSRSLMQSLLEKCASVVPDMRLSRLLFLLDKNRDHRTFISHQALEQMEALMAVEENHEMPSCSLDTADSAARVNSALSTVLATGNPERSPSAVSQNLYCSLLSVLHGRPDRLACAAQISRTAWALEGSGTDCLLRILLEWSEDARLDVNSRREWGRHLAGLGLLSPFELWWSVDPLLRQGYIAAFTPSSHPPAPWLMLESNESQDISSVQKLYSGSFGLWCVMRRLLRDHDTENALVAAQKLLAEDMNPFLRRQATRTIPSCLLSLERYSECIVFLAESVTGDPSLNPIMPIREVVDALSDDAKIYMSELLAFVVVMDLYVSRSTEDCAYLRSFAAEDFLAAHSLERPSILRDHTKKFDHVLLVHFLRHICVESVMDSWVVFGSSNEVSRERAAVCQLLAELDPENKDEYQAEIRSIMRKLTLSKRIREVEQSKIHVDTISVKNVARDTLKESFSRYMAFVRTGMSPEEKSRLRDTRQRVAQGDVEALLSGAFPRNEMTSLLESIVARLRDEFVSSSQHGLDGYLSVRIRHGTLAGQLRGPLEAENLVTLRDAKSGTYKPNTNWPQELQVADTDLEKCLQKSLSEFTSGFDTLIEEMKTSWLQIKKTPDAPGLIDFVLLRPEVDYLSTGIKEDMSFDAFLDYVFEYFFTEKLEPSLKDIRQVLQTTAKPRVNDMLLALQTNVDRALTADGSWKLRTAIGRARTQLQNILDRITGWFRLTKAEMLREPFSIEEAVNIGTASIQAACPEFRTNLNVPKELDSFRISGNLPSFVDLLFLVFENAVRHSQMSPVPAVDVAVSLADDILNIRCENALGDNVPSPDAKATIAGIRKNLHSNVFSQSVTTEGGTGFFKMQKILHHDFSSAVGTRKPTLDFGVSDESQFFVHMTIPIHEWEQRSQDHENADY
ncbi:MAG: hypothetical protein CMJ19_01675 [Phycisphaeraceae bacterium]|nr:hypothetical protein [Phycisphaeraceae bacterium]